MTSHDLLHRWTRQKDEVAFRELVSRHAPMVFSTAKRILGNEVEAEDVAQECFETLASTRRPFSGHLGAWLHRVATNRCIDRIRASQRRTVREKSFMDQRDPHAEVAWDDIYEHVDAAIASLSAKHREPIVAYFLEGRSHEEIAAELNLSRQAVTYRIRRGIDAVRNSLKNRGVQISASALTAMLAEHCVSTAMPITLAATLGKIALGAAATAGTASTVAAMGIGVTKLATATLTIGVVTAGAALWSLNASRSTPPAAPPVAEASTPLAADAKASTETPSPTWPNGPSNLPPPQVIQGTLKPPTGASISGVVVRADGHLFANARVEFEHLPSIRGQSNAPFEPIALITADTDQQGTFTKYGLAEGPYSLSVTPPNSTSGGPGYEVARVTLKKDEHRSNVRLVYGSEGRLTIEGKLVNNIGEPVWEVEVIASNRGLSRSAITGPDGKFVIDSLPEGEFRLSARKSMSSPTRRSGHTLNADATARAGEHDVKMIMPRPGIISGQVVRSGTLEPFKSFNVSVFEERNPDYSFWQTQDMEPFEDDQGRFRMPLLPPGDLRITAVAEGFGPHSEVIHLEEGQELKDVVVALAPARALTGRVVDESGKPVPGAEIRGGRLENPRYIDPRTRDQQVVAATSDKDGNFSLANAPDNLKLISAYHSKFAPTVVAPSDGMVIVMQKAASLAISVSEGGIPLSEANWIVRLERYPKIAYDVFGQTDKNGYALAEGVLPGERVVEVCNPNAPQSRCRTNTILFEPGAEYSLAIDFEPASAALEGTVTWRGTPASDAMFFLWVQTKDGIEEFRGNPTIEGAYWFDALPPGHASLRVYIPGAGSTRSEAYRELDIAAGSKTRLDVALSGASRIEGRTKPASEAGEIFISACEGRHSLDDVNAQTKMGEGALHAHFASRSQDQSGRYSIEALEPGEYTVVAVERSKIDYSGGSFLGIGYVTVTAGETAVVNFDGN